MRRRVVEEGEARTGRPWWREVIGVLAYAAVVVLLIHIFVVGMYRIPSNSMSPTLEQDDYILVPLFWYSLPNVEPKRGQVIVFKYPVDPKHDFVKRLIGLPGDIVEIREGRVFVNNREIAEPYVYNRDNDTRPPVTVPPRHYYFLGDNRPHSQDSRYWDFVPAGFIRGPAMFRYWPLKRAGLLE